MREDNVWDRIILVCIYIFAGNVAFYILVRVLLYVWSLVVIDRRCVSIFGIYVCDVT